MTGHRSADVVTGYFRAGAAQTSAVAGVMDVGKLMQAPPSHLSDDLRIGPAR
jgi:hypothetical protein